MFTKESLERLRERIDLVEALSGHVDLKRSGSTYKALCPFHQEKNPSFVVQRGDHHYHCFGCGAHGDAIQFLMTYVNISFSEAVETLAERFHVPMERSEKTEETGVNKSILKEACGTAAAFFHFCLLHYKGGEEALHYLYKRGLTIDFIRRFQIGFAPQENFLQAMRQERLSDQALIEAGLLSESSMRPFFRDRITFPIRNASGSVIGFSARNYKENAFGGKYINTPETALFKKSRLLFGLDASRRRIAKDRKVIIVEGQIDCLKLIESGLNLTVAALGTACGESHVRELGQLGVRMAYLLFDADEAGATATSKVGDLFQQAGIEARIVQLPKGNDPDSFLTQFGIEKLIFELDRAIDYLTFQVAHLSKGIAFASPAGKAEIAKILKKQIEEWEDPVMVHESVKKVASLLHVPEETLGITTFYTSSYVKKNMSLPFISIDPNRILELDLLRWLILLGEEHPDFITTARQYLREEHFHIASCRQLFAAYLQADEQKRAKDILSLAACIEEQNMMDELLQKRINREKAEMHFLETVQKLLDRQWMQTREEVKMRIHSGMYNEEEILELVKQFDAPNRQKVSLCSNT